LEVSLALEIKAVQCEGKITMQNILFYILPLRNTTALPCIINFINDTTFAIQLGCLMLPTIVSESRLALV